MAYFKSLSFSLILLASLPLQILATPIPYDGQMIPTQSKPEIHAATSEVPAANSEQPAGLSSLGSTTTSTSSETTNLLSGNNLQGIGNVAGNSLLSNNNGNRLAGDVNLLGEQSESGDESTTATTLINSANGAKGQ